MSSYKVKKNKKQEYNCKIFINIDNKKNPPTFLRYGSDLFCLVT